MAVSKIRKKGQTKNGDKNIETPKIMKAKKWDLPDQ